MPPRNFWTNVWLTIATFGEVALSLAVKSRPAITGISMVSKYPGLM